jgi:pimeloyl-ACP methyl ester carboxylesterase
VDLRPSSRNRPAYPSPGDVRRLVTSDGVAVSAAYDRGRGPTAPAFVVAHGFTGSWARPDSRRIAAALADHGGVVSVDLRGHGRSGGASTLGDSEVHDVDAAVRYARWLGHPAVVTVGFSLGGSVVLRQGALASPSERPDAVVAVSSAGFWFYQGTAPMRLLHRVVYSRSGRTALRTGFGTRVLPRPWVEPYPMSPSEAAAQLAPTPLLVVHGDSDGYFPLEHPELVVASARLGAVERGVDDLTDYWVEAGFAHAEAAASRELVARIGSWGAVAAGRHEPVAGRRDSTERAPR